MVVWLFFFICSHNQLDSIQFKGYRCLKKIIHLIDSKNEWLLLSAGFTAKFELVFVSTLENCFSWKFHFKASGKCVGSSKELGILKTALRLRDQYVFM